MRCNDKEFLICIKTKEIINAIKIISVEINKSFFNIVNSSLLLSHYLDFAKQSFLNYAPFLEFPLQNAEKENIRFDPDVQLCSHTFLKHSKE